jgi:nucleotide-binding universal stress UspA family protein
MKKVLLAFDGRHFSKGVFEFVREMNRKQAVMAVGIFLPAVDYTELLYSYGGMPAGPIYINDVVDADDNVVNEHIARFSTLCSANGIAFQLHEDFTKHAVQHIREETRFADLLVISSHSFYENLGEETQEDYIESALHKAECPVVLVPEDYKEPASIIMAYDGSAQSVYAIKQFSYLFPEFREKQALLVYVDKGRPGVPDRADIESLLSGYFSRLSIFKLKIDERKDLEKWLDINGDTILVAGAFGRSLFSGMLKKSFIKDVIHHHKVPVFVAHK